MVLQVGAIARTGNESFFAWNNWMKQIRSQDLGVLIGIASCCFGGTAAAVTKYLAGGADALTLAILRWGIGFCCVLPVALFLGVRWPRRNDWFGIACLGVAFFGLFFILYNLAVSYTTAARASLALATLPVQTMLVAGLFRVEKLTLRKSVGVGVAIFGVIGTLASGLSAAPPGAWRGELIMISAAFCMACYNVWSRPFVQRSSVLGFLTVGMGFGAAALITVGLLTNRVAILTGFGMRQWLGGIYLGMGGGAVAFTLWVWALERATPTRVASTMAVNPIAAALLASHLVGEAIAPRLIFGLAAVLAGIWIAATELGARQGGSHGIPMAPSAALSVDAERSHPQTEELDRQISKSGIPASTRFLVRFGIAQERANRSENGGRSWNGEE